MPGIARLKARYEAMTIRTQLAFPRSFADTQFLVSCQSIASRSPPHTTYFITLPHFTNAHRKSFAFESIAIRVMISSHSSQHISSPIATRRSPRRSTLPAASRITALAHERGFYAMRYCRNELSPSCRRHARRCRDDDGADDFIYALTS